jgi:CHAT domain/TIR domain
VLALTREDGRADLVAAHRLVDLLRQARPMPRLVVLNSCSGAESGATDLFSGSAAALVRGGVSAVAAMQYEISDPAAVAFARGFYAAIARGRGVDDAVTSGRVAILGVSDRTLEWVTPVLYLRGHDTQLFVLLPAATSHPAAEHVGREHSGAEHTNVADTDGTRQFPFAVNIAAPKVTLETGGLDAEGTVPPTPVRVFISYAHDDPVHEARVRDFWQFLRDSGVDARADLAAAERRQDWVMWMTREIRAAERVLVVASPEYKRRAEGDAGPGEGRGVQFEVGLIQERLYADQRAGMNQVLPVVLPGCSADGIPMWLRPVSTTHYVVSEYTVDGAEKLLRLLTGQPWAIERPLGSVPVLPPWDIATSGSALRRTEPLPSDKPQVPPAGISGKPPVSAGQAAAEDRVLSAARQVQGGRFDVVAEGGCGKTTLLNKLTTGLRNLSYATLSITVSPPSNAPDTTDELDRMRGDEATYRELIAWMANDISKACADGAETPRILEERIGKRIQEQMRAARYAESRDSGSAVDLLRARGLASKAEFVAAMEKLASYCRVAVLVDDLHLILGTGAGRWLLGAFGELPQVLIVYARRPDAGREVADPRAEILRLEPMTEDETRAFARRELTGWAPAEAAEIGSLVFNVTGGYPVWVTSCFQMIASDEQPGAVLGQVRARLLGAPGPDRLQARFRDYVDDFAAGILGDRTPLFDQLAVLRRVTRDMLITLLGKRSFGRGDASRLFDWLRRSAFMTAIDDDDESIRLHDLIRRQMEARLRQHDVMAYRELHATAERYYRSRMDLDEDQRENDSPYQLGTRYEDPEWQRDSREWLHHAGQVDDAGFAVVERALVRLFFDAFWWWDSDSGTQSGYCEKLLTDYRMLPRRQTGDGWLSLLEEFYRSYVAGTANRITGQDGERWARTDDALRRLWLSYQLSHERIPEDRDLRRIQILICIYRGDAAWYGSTGDDASRQEAADWYKAAEQASSACDEDKWIANWAMFYQADLWVETDPDRAAQLVRGLGRRIDVGEDEEDNELRVHLTWLYGDLAWRDGDQPRSFDIYARAVLHAFVFHVRQLHMPQNPDRFTVSVYQLILDRTRRRLDEARADGLNEVADAAVVRTRGLFGPYWEHVRTDPDNENGFPPQPQESDLNRLDTPFAGNVMWVIDNMSGQLNAPLNAPLDYGT